MLECFYYKLKKSHRNGPKNELTVQNVFWIASLPPGGIEPGALRQPVRRADAEGQGRQGAEGEQPPPAGRGHDDRGQQHLRARAERPEAVQQHHALSPLMVEYV